MADKEKKPEPKAETGDPFDALFTGEIVMPVVMDEADDPARSSD